MDGGVGNSESNLGFDDLGFESGPDTTIDVGSQGAPSIDDFIGMEEARQEQFDAKNEEMSKLKGDDEGAKSSDETQELSKDDEQEQEAKADDEENEEADGDESDEESVDKKFFKAKVGEKEVDLDEDTMIPVKIDGKVEYFSARDLVNDFSGKTNWNRKYSEFDLEKKNHETLVNESKVIKHERESFLENFSNTLKEEGAFEALKKNLDHFGVDKYTFMKGLRDAYIPQVEEYIYMTPEEREAVDLKMENEYLREKTEMANSQLSSSQQIAQVNEQIAKVTEQFGFTREDFKDAYTSAIESGQFKEEDVTIDFLTNRIRDNRAIDSALHLLKEINPNISQLEGAREAVQTVAGWYRDVQDGKMTEQEIKELVFEVMEVDSKTAKELSDKLGNSDEVKQSKKKRTPKEHTYLSFDEFEI